MCGKKHMQCPYSLVSWNTHAHPCPRLLWMSIFVLCSIACWSKRGAWGHVTFFRSQLHRWSQETITAQSRCRWHDALLQRIRCQAAGRANAPCSGQDWHHCSTLCPLTACKILETYIAPYQKHETVYTHNMKQIVGPVTWLGKDMYVNWLESNPPPCTSFQMFNSHHDHYTWPRKSLLGLLPQDETCVGETGAPFAFWEGIQRDSSKCPTTWLRTDR